jgi:hypothetical protein
MQSFRGGMPVGRNGMVAISLLWVAMIVPLRLGIINAITLSLAALALLTIPLLFVRSRIEVAADGIFLRWLWWRRFVGFDRIEGVWYEPPVVNRFGRTKKNAELVVVRKGRKPLRITGRATAHDLSRARDAIDRELTTYQAKGERVPFDGARLSRGESDAKAWLDRLRTLVKGAETFREAPPTHDDLARIVDDAHATEEHRAAAAVALAATGDQGKARLRVARDSTADPKLRVAIDAAISDDERALSDALAEIGRTEQL